MPDIPMWADYILLTMLAFLLGFVVNAIWKRGDNNAKRAEEIRAHVEEAIKTLATKEELKKAIEALVENCNIKRSSCQGPQWMEKEITALRDSQHRIETELREGQHRIERKMERLIGSIEGLKGKTED